MEFELIQRYFTQPFTALQMRNKNAVLCGIGDDCARLKLAANMQLLVSADTLVSGIHFFADTPPADIAWKALAVNLSDLAASGASPLGFTLSISAPDLPDLWLEQFSQGLLEIATLFDCPLVGGDTTGAPHTLLVAITAMGQAPLQHTGFNRGNAQTGDQVWVSGLPGLARLGLLHEYKQRGMLSLLLQASQLEPAQAMLLDAPEHLLASALRALHRPIARLNLGQALHGIANAAIDLSDGLSGDLAHIAKASHVSIVLNTSALAALWLQAWPECTPHLDFLIGTSLAGGDDFELAFTIPACQQSQMQIISSRCQVSLHPIGQVTVGQGMWTIDSSGNPAALQSSSFNHFTKI